AEGDISADWRFGIAYNGAFKLCTILLYASGDRAEKNFQHYRPIAALPLILGEPRKDDADYLEICRGKSKTVEYVRAGAATMADALELVEFARDLRSEVVEWLKQQHPELLQKK